MQLKGLHIVKVENAMELQMTECKRMQNLYQHVYKKLIFVNLTKSSYKDLFFSQDFEK